MRVLAAVAFVTLISTPFASAQDASSFHAMAPCRVIDTRSFADPFGPPKLVAQATRDFPMTASACAIPSTATAVQINIAVTNTEAQGFLTLFPEGATQLTASSINFAAGETVSNAATIPLSATGGMTILSKSATDVIVDVTGYFEGPVVSTVNGLSGAVTLSAGANVEITPTGNTLTIAANAPAGPEGPTGPTGPCSIRRGIRARTLSSMPRPPTTTLRLTGKSSSRSSA
jgi:hypothetical protein